MTTENAIDLILILIAFPSLLFLVGYGAFFRWRRSWEGRALITSALGLFLLAATFLAGDTLPVPEWVWLPIGVVIAAGAWQKLGLLIQVWPKRSRGRVDS